MIAYWVRYMSTGALARAGRCWLLALAVGAMAGTADAGTASNPFRLSPERQATADSLVARISRLPTTGAQVAAYHRHFREASERREVAFALALNNGYVQAARGLASASEMHAAILGVLQVVDLGRFGPRGASHFEMDLMRRSAYAGNIDAGERIFLRILARPDSLLHPYTAASAHYCAAYCAYYSNRVGRGARHIARAAELFAGLGDDTRALEAFDGACATYLKLGRVDSAMLYARRGLAIEPTITGRVSLNLALNYAECLGASGLVDSALHYARAAEAFAVTLGDPGLEARAQFALGNVRMNGAAYLDARRHYLRADSLFRGTDEAYQASDVLDSLGRAYAYTGDYPAAYRTQARAFHLRDSLRADRVGKDADTEAAERERDRMAAALEVAERERALAEALVGQRATERLALLAGGALLLLAVAFLVYRARARANVSRELRRLVDQRTAELRDRGAALEAQTRRLSESNTELERFAYIASHDLKTPLRNITSFLGLIRRRLPAEARALVEEYLEIAIGNASHMTELISDVLEFSRLNADLDELATPLRISKAVAGVRENLRAELTERDAAIETVGDAEVSMPRGALNQLLGNLISNGLKYNRSPRPLIRVVTEVTDERVRIAVVDNGIGIAPEFHDKIFEVFRRLHTSDEYAGTGVGLASCRKIALRLGGDVTVESVVGEGTTFTVDLPRQASGKRDGSVAAEAPAAAAAPVAA